ncbi:uncharacterized protein MONOS_14064 [Monocercomonoides exilis]|uniref:uncharacterized protein n=1 Tax=Monocercomonoides exilis TaxID=2049356 RepID=UPI003559A41C|nr:hypothetical protein MONOS_14064 [Monocercomonoides exilis]|eukprot:MONOS_14064.1-p1 / transcript=MONOS_14064.1 / gene=MONOS_14064 / organism=Monocercomonoides_exilis_PA203 / gene_product=unspecified product / transcript_product=unspecified product / location=Mono_scaffold00930:4442-4807(+) / protein_length=122 / sequence_SO=supercontig / SO=protein_coding / is_pseudo=false
MRKEKSVKETRFIALRREKAKRNSFVIELLIPTTLASENTPHNTQQRLRADWRQTRCTTEKDVHRQKETWSESFKINDKELIRTEFSKMNVSEARRERKGVEPVAAPSSAGSQLIRRTMTC